MISPVRLSLKSSVPAKSAGRLVDALTDLIRPITERQGLKGDMIRLQREEVALRIAEIAMERVAIEKGKIRPIPLKALVPLLEKSSLEDPKDATMINLWANLLASAAMGAQSNVPRYVSILSEINGRQARLVQKMIVRNKRKWRARRADLLVDDLWAADQAGVLMRLQQAAPIGDLNRINDLIFEGLDMDGVAVSEIVLTKGEDQWDGGGKYAKRLAQLSDEIVDLEVLESLNLVKDGSFKNANFEEFGISVFFHRVTALCVEMFSACNPSLFLAKA